MDYKKKYEQALDNFKKIKAANKYNNELVDFIEYKYPELKENEDERIRNFLISKMKEVGNVWKEYSSKDIIAWLEKQGEQKSTDKVEPKFKVGDWIVQEGVGTYKVVEVCNWYEVIGIDGNQYSISFLQENDCYLWTIHDAKDGDVLAVDSGSSICIFDGTVEEGIYPFAYCGFTRYGFESYDRKLPFTHDKNICPATKEQHDFLFKKMKEAGYEWDAEKKELKKAESKSAWSEENSCYYDDICEILINLINSPTSNVNKDVVQKDLDWLMSVKELQLKHAWSEEDEDYCSDVNAAVNDHFDEGYAEELKDWLKSLTERVKGE